RALARPAVRRCRPRTRGRGSCRGKEFHRVDRLSEATDLEMQLHLIGVAVAHLGDLLALRNQLAFLDHDLSVVRVRRQESRSVLADAELPVTAQARARIADLARRPGNDRSPALAHTAG